MRLSKAVKDDVVSLLEIGLTPRVIMNKYHPVEREDPASKPVTAGDVYSLARRANLLGTGFRSQWPILPMIFDSLYFLLLKDTIIETLKLKMSPNA